VKLETKQVKGMKKQRRKSKLTSNAQGLQFPLDRKRVSETPQRQG
jgi:hypothetical protein